MVLQGLILDYLLSWLSQITTYRIKIVVCLPECVSVNCNTGHLLAELANGQLS